jgi:hypothetical protein
LAGQAAPQTPEGHDPGRPGGTLDRPAGPRGTVAAGIRAGLGVAMALRIVCMCGYVIQGDDGEELWANARDHMGVLHPELVAHVSRDDILAQAELL